MNDFHSQVQVISTQVQVHAYKYVREIAQDIVTEAKEIMETQRYNWQPLEPGYLLSKYFRGYDTRILIATGFYQENITWGVTDENKIWIGVNNVIHPDSKLPLVVLARIHEFGTATIPARPLWRPLFSKYLRNNKRYALRYKEEVERAVVRARKHKTELKKVKIRR